MMRVRVKLAIKLFITAILLWIAFRSVDFAAVSALLAAVSPVWVAAAILLTSLIILFDGIQLAAAMRVFERRVPLATALRYSVVGWFFSNVAPSTVGGDVFRGVQLARVGMPIGTAVRAVLAIRLLSFATLVLVMLAGFPFALRIVDDKQGLALVATTLAAAAAALVAVYWFESFRWRIPLLEKWAVLEKLRTVSRDCRGLLLKDSHAVTAWLAAGAQHLVRVCVLACLAAGLGLGIPFATLFALTPAALLVAMIPISVGGWGVREVTFVYLLGTAGVGATAALSLSIAFGILRILIGAVGGLTWALLNDDHFRVNAPPA